jgi:nitrite reductase/ring-hydroxylating ferredoxin subunit
MATLVRIARFSELVPDEPRGVSVAGVDLVVVRRGDDVNVLSGRCLHQGALMAEGRVTGDLLECPLHQWAYRIDSGELVFNPAVGLRTFSVVVDRGADSVLVDEAEVSDWASRHA